MKKFVKCVDSFSPVLYCNLKGEKIKVGSVWAVYHGTTAPGLDIHLEGTDHYSGKYMDLSKKDLYKHFINQ